MSAARSRKWCFTLKVEGNSAPAWNKEEMNYLVYQKEEGGTTHYLHYQGYVEFKKENRLKTVKALLGGKDVHADIRRGTAEQAAAYCKKQDATYREGPWEFGAICYPGKRTDIHDMHRDIIAGASKKDILEKHPEMFYKFTRGINEAIKELDEEKERDDIECILIYGPTGTGKSRWARELLPGAFWCSNRWWERYRGEQDVVIDEFRGWIAKHEMLRILDRYKYRVEEKGTSHALRATRIIVTTNQMISEWYKEPDGADALARRFHRVVLVENKAKYFFTSYERFVNFMQKRIK